MNMGTEPSNGVWVRAMRQREFAAILDWFSWWFFGCGFAILIAIDLMTAFGAGGVGHFLRAATSGLLLAGSTFMAGWLLGLLFGIPRALSRPGSVAPPPSPPGGAAQTGSDAKPASRTNTNLEDVSDWLTKTIIGLGLVNLLAMPHFLWTKAGVIGGQIFRDEPAAASLTLLISAYFAIGGFWIGYVGTRTIITLLFNDVDLGPDPAAVATSTNPGNLQIEPGGGGIKPAQDGLALADAQFLSKPLTAMSNVGELAGWAAAKARSGDLDTALAVLKDMVRTAPDNPTVKQLLETVERSKATT